jgi:hypothetical protein
MLKIFTSQPLTESQGDLPNRPATAFSIAVPALYIFANTCQSAMLKIFTSQPLTESQGDLPNRPATAFSIAVPALSVTFYATYYYQNVVL